MANRCKLCGCEMRKTDPNDKRQHICTECAMKLPLGVRRSNMDFTADQLRRIQTIATPWAEGPMEQLEEWKVCGGFIVCPTYIVLNGFRYDLQNLRTINLNFHPHEIGNEPNTALGVASIVLETKTPHILIEEAFLTKESVAGYVITGMDISYYLSEAIEEMVRSVQITLAAGKHCIEEAYRYVSQEKAKRKEEQKRRRAEEAERQRAERASAAQHDRKQTPLEQALVMFGLKQPFTQAQLKKSWHKILTTQKVHPDNGGSNEKFRQYQNAYELLTKFATQK